MIFYYASHRPIKRIKIDQKQVSALILFFPNLLAIASNQILKYNLIEILNIMTISYQEEFSSLMMRWRGSLWKAVLKDAIAFYIVYYIILFSQVFA